MFNIGTIFIAVLIIIILAIFVTLFRMVGFTRWAIIDGLRLNRLFKQPRRESLSFVELKSNAANVLWTKMKVGKPTYRNGSKLQEIHPLSEEQGHKYVTISRDNRPFQNVCHILVDTDIAGIEVKMTVVAQDAKAYENMMNIMGWNLKDVLKNLRAVDAGDSEAKQNIIDRYIEYMLREIL